MNPIIFCFGKNLFLGLKPAWNDSRLPLMLSSWRDLTAGVGKRRPLVDTLGHQSIGPNVVFESLEL